MSFLSHTGDKVFTLWGKKSYNKYSTWLLLKLITVFKKLIREFHAKYITWNNGFIASTVMLLLVYLFCNVYGLHVSVLLWLSQLLPFALLAMNILEIL